MYLRYSTSTKSSLNTLIHEINSQRNHNYSYEANNIRIHDLRIKTKLSIQQTTQYARKGARESSIDLENESPKSSDAAERWASETGPGIVTAPQIEAAKSSASNPPRYLAIPAPMNLRISKHRKSHLQFGSGSTANVRFFRLRRLEQWHTRQQQEDMKEGMHFAATTSSEECVYLRMQLD